MSSTNPFDDGSDESSKNSSKQQSKDISDTIKIANDFAFVGEGGNDDDEYDNGQDCFLPLKGALDEHVAPIVEPALENFKGAMNEHVVPKVDVAAKSIQSAFDEHVSPRARSVKKGFDDHIVPGVNHIRTSSVEGLEAFNSKSLETFQGAKEGTQRFLGEVQKTSVRSIEEIQNQSKAFLENTQKTIEGVPTQTRAVFDEKLRPSYEALTVTYADRFTGTARGFSDLMTSEGESIIPWYMVLEEATLRAFGRVVFCDNPLTGSFIFLGILCSSPLAAVCALLAVIMVNSAAIYLDMDTDTVRSGQCGRNAVLLGTTLVDSFGFIFPETGNLQSGVSVLIFLSIALAPLTLLVEFVWSKMVPNSIPSLLLPYNIVLLGTVMCASVWNVAMETQVIFPSPQDLDEEPTPFFLPSALLNGISRIFCVDGNLWSGGLILVGVLFCSRIVAAGLVAGSLGAGFVLGYLVFGENHQYLDFGYAGFNPALCVAGIFYYLVPSWKLTGLAGFGIISTLLVQSAVDVVLEILGTPVPTTLGFCLTLLPILSMGFPSMEREETYFIRTISEAELSTPEDYLKSLEENNAGDLANTDSSSGDDDDDDLEAQSPTNEGTPLLS